METVTSKRLASRDHYRLQVNADQELIAFIYNAMAEFYARPTMERVRNEMAIFAGQQLRADAAKFIKTDRAFSAFLQTYAARSIEPALQSRARALYRELGWTEQNASTLL